MNALRLALILLALVLLVVACGGEQPALGPNEQAQVTCTEECAERGQCGTLTDGRRAVLAGDPFPTLSPLTHTRFFLDESLVTVVEVQAHDIVAAEGGVAQLAVATPFAHTFYRVTGENKTGWVSAWCVARP